MISSLSVSPRVLYGRLQLGVGYASILDRPNSLAEQTFGSVNFYMGPFSFLSSFRPGLFRTAVSIRFNSYSASVANEWINNIAEGRNIQPRFTMALGASL
jgi:hypothetical protein